MTTPRPFLRAPLRSWWLLGLLLAVGLLPLRPAAAARADYQDTAEWSRLVQFWHLLLDHSSGAVYSPARGRELSDSLEGVEADLKTLMDQKLLPAEEGENLGWIFHAARRVCEGSLLQRAAEWVARPQGFRRGGRAGLAMDRRNAVGFSAKDEPDGGGGPGYGGDDPQQPGKGMLLSQAPRGVAAGLARGHLGRAKRQAR